MQKLIQIESGDQRLLSQIAAAMAEAARRSGEWVVCRPGCIQCCIGPFAITALDALRLRRGLSVLDAVDPDRAARVRARAAEYVAAIATEYPGDPVTGELWDEDALPPSMDDLPCPALDADSGLCDLYEARPVTCRSFGPATRMGEDAVAACELCYTGATEEQIAGCAVHIDPEGLEGALIDALGGAGMRGMTVVAWALTQPEPAGR
jgi:Fe-S-cluster containining protein